MANWDQLHFQDARAVYRLIGECRDLAAEPSLWAKHAMRGLCHLIGATASTGGEGLLVGQDRKIVPLTPIQYGLDSNARSVLRAYVADGAVASDPLVVAVHRASGKLVTRTRTQIVPDRVYYRSPVFTRYLRRAEIGPRLASIYETREGRSVNNIHLHRSPGERDFSEREQQVLDFFHAEVGPMIGGSLVSETEPHPENMSPRLRQTLMCLLDGDSEKQVAARLHLSRTTVHQYVGALYRHFGVRSRAQLMSHAMKRMGSWQAGLSRQDDSRSI
jgi:DNA-binding CsgD family transcriptional regulator